MWATRSLLLLLFIASPVLAVSKADLEARIIQLEQKLNRILLDQNDQDSRLRREMQQLRGEMEVQSHEMQKLQKKQNDLYLDIDRRLNLLQSGPGRSPTYRGDTAGGAWRQDVIEPEGATGSGGPATSDDGAARQEYDRALETLKKGRYDQAQAEFRSFLKQYPDSSYADNAQYWVGEVHYVTRKFPEALQAFWHRFFNDLHMMIPNERDVRKCRFTIPDPIWIDSQFAILTENR